MKDVKIGDYIYQIGKLKLLDQAAVAKRAGPMLVSILKAQSFSALVAANEPSADEDDAKAIGDIVEPLAQALAAASDEDVQMIIGTCLSVVRRKHPGDTGYADVWNKALKEPMFDDLTLVDTVMIVFEVLKENVGPFTLARP